MLMDRTQRRLLYALGASALLHLWFVQASQQTGAPRVTVAAESPSAARLNLRLAAELSPDAASNPAPAPESNVTDNVPESVPAKVAVVAPVAATTPALPPVVPAVAAPSGSSAVQMPPSDPTYYAARDLDVFPKAITALDLDGRGAAGKVRATVLIDESGAVNEVRTIEASAAALESAARDLLLRTRFTPASKDGRIVKAQVLVSLDYGAP